VIACLVKKEIVIGIIGYVQGIRSAKIPPKIAKRRNVPSGMLLKSPVPLLGAAAAITAGKSSSGPPLAGVIVSP
jgi:hypothetical protein